MLNDNLSLTLSLLTCSSLDFVCFDVKYFLKMIFLFFGVRYNLKIVVKATTFLVNQENLTEFS
jgi:hypothetical protein